MGRGADEEHGGHIEEEVDLAGNVSKLGTGVVVLLQVEGEEQIGLVVLKGIPGVEIERALCPSVADFVIGDLKQEFDRFPAGEQGFVLAQLAVTVVELGEECVRGAA